MEQNNFIYEHEINFGQLLTRLRYKIKRIILSSIIFTIVFLGYICVTQKTTLTQVTTTTYKPTSNYIGITKMFIGSGVDTDTAIALHTYITSNKILNTIIEQLDLNYSSDELLNMISLSGSSETIIYITITGNDKDSVKQILDYYPSAISDGLSTNFNVSNITIIEPSYIKTNNYNETINKTEFNSVTLVLRLVKYSLIGFIIGIFIASLVYLIIFMTDNKIIDEKDVKGYLGLIVLAVIPLNKKSKKHIIIKSKKFKKFS